MDKMNKVYPFHSFVDVITNSSTVIYCGVAEQAESAVYGIINAVLRESGSDKKAEDLFYVKVVDKDILLRQLEKKGLERHTDEWYEEFDNIQESLDSRSSQVTATLDTDVYTGGYIEISSKETGDDTLEKLLGNLFVVHEEYH
jgi:hypothetical protein